MTVIPSLTAGIECQVVERIIEGDIVIRTRETDALLHGAVTVGFGRLFVRPCAALVAADQGWMTGGAPAGLMF